MRYVCGLIGHIARECNSAGAELCRTANSFPYGMFLCGSVFAKPFHRERKGTYSERRSGVDNTGGSTRPKMGGDMVARAHKDGPRMKGHVAEKRVIPLENNQEAVSGNSKKERELRLIELSRSLAWIMIDLLL